MKNNLKIILIGAIFLTAPFIAQAAEVSFNVDPSYDYLERPSVTAFLHQLGNNVYFYVENDFYKTLDVEKRTEFTEALKNLSLEFDQTIYPKLTGTFGSEWKPGIDNDNKITVLITQIKDEAGGYFNSGDEYPKAQSPLSNEREIIYLNAKYITSPLAKSALAHEFTHLITFNQKERVYGVTEETWLNEARAEYAPTLLGYDQIYDGSNLQRRVRIFTLNPQDPLTEWKDSSADYGVLNLFTQYLVDYYGVKILVDSLHSDKTGITALNAVLKKNNYAEYFPQIFTDWSVAVLVNDCKIGPKYCYQNPNLKNLKIMPQLSYLPIIGDSNLTVTNYAKNWAGNWYKFIGGQGTLKLEFISNSSVKFAIPYITRDSSGKYNVSFLNLDNQRGTISIPDFGKTYDSLFIIPSIQQKMFGFNGIESYYQFVWSASVISNSPQKEEDAKIIQGLLNQIDLLKKEIARIQGQINAALGGGEFCPKFENNLYLGISNSNEVRCLQGFLRNKGTGVYPEGLMTGNYYSLTQLALKRYQASKGIIATGYFGPLTRSAVNKELGLE